MSNFAIYGNVSHFENAHMYMRAAGSQGRDALLYSTFTFTSETRPNLYELFKVPLSTILGHHISILVDVSSALTSVRAALYSLDICTLC